MLSAAKNRIEGLGEPTVAVPEQELDRSSVVGEVHQEVAGGLSGPRPGRMRGYSHQMCPAGTVLDCDQRIDPSEQHGVHVHQVHRQDSFGLRSEERAPTGA
jgi:hypothetical protein